MSEARASWASRISRLTKRMTGGWFAKSRASAKPSSSPSGPELNSASKSRTSSITDSEDANVRRIASSSSSFETGISSAGTPNDCSKSSRTSTAGSRSVATFRCSPSTSSGRMP